MREKTPETAQTSETHHQAAVNLHQLNADLHDWYWIHQLRFEELFYPPLPGESQAELHKVVRDLDAQRYEPAISKCDKTISLAPEHPVAYCLRANAFHQLGQYEAAISDYGVAIELTGKSVKTLRFSVLGMSDLLVMSDEYLSMCHANRSLSLHASGDHEAAIDDEKEAIRLDPNNARSHSQHGRSLLESGDLAGAMTILERAVELDPSDGDAHFHLGWCHACLGRSTEAIESYTHAIQLKPADPIFRIHRSYAHYNQGRLDSALVDANKAVEIDPSCCDSYYARAQVFLYLKEYNLSLANYQVCLGKTWNISAAYNGCGNCRLELRDYEGALKDYRACLSLSQEQPDPELLNNLAWLLSTCPDDQLRNGEEAVRLATAACTQSNWTAPHQLGTLAAAYAEIGDFTQAIRWHEEAIALAEPAEQESYQLELNCYKQGKPCRDPHI